MAAMNAVSLRTVKRIRIECDHIVASELNKSAITKQIRLPNGTVQTRVDICFVFLKKPRTLQPVMNSPKWFALY